MLEAPSRSARISGDWETENWHFQSSTLLQNWKSGNQVYFKFNKVGRWRKQREFNIKSWGLQSITDKDKLLFLELRLCIFGALTTLSLTSYMVPLRTNLTSWTSPQLPAGNIATFSMWYQIQPFQVIFLLSHHRWLFLSISIIPLSVSLSTVAKCQIMK